MLKKLLRHLKGLASEIRVAQKAIYGRPTGKFGKSLNLPAGRLTGTDEPTIVGPSSVLACEHEVSFGLMDIVWSERGIEGQGWYRGRGHKRSERTTCREVAGRENARAVPLIAEKNAHLSWYVVHALTIPEHASTRQAEQSLSDRAAGKSEVRQQ
jgi:hypothetical protein